jgi:hypothetical protein
MGEAVVVESVVDLPAVVERYLAGESMGDLSKEVGCSRRTLYRWMLAEYGGEKYRELVTQCLVARIADADEQLEGAKNLLDIQKARETQRFSRMDFERRRPALYGQKQEVKHTGGGAMLSIVLLDQPTAVVEKVVTDVVTDEEGVANG